MTSEERKAYNKKYYANHRDQQKAAAKQWRDANPDYNKQWKAQHKDQQQAYIKQWYAQHKDQQREAVKQWRDANPDYIKKWKDANPDYMKKWCSSDHASIYEITNILNGKKYIGSTIKNPQKRWLCHKAYIKTHPHRPLYRDMLEFGIENFKMEVLFTVPKDQARKAEQAVMDGYTGELYNKMRAKR